MRRFVQRFPSLLAPNLIHHPPTILRHPKINPRVVVPSLDRVTSRFVFFSSESNSARGLGSDEVVSKEELKKRIQSFLDDGDEDALPDLFEAMMTRKLSGKHDESDDEVMEEVRKYPINDSHKVDDNVESDGDSSDSDIESDDLSDGDSDEESDDLSDGDSSDSDEEFDGLKDVDLSGRGIKIDGLKDVDLSGLDVKIDGLKDVNLSGLGIKIGGLKPDHSSYFDSESD
ncbi:hypothetical protein BRARA_B02068 [Brassica rapa]|uniref:Uncharacterized protein n=1 Tax=Brassica campestris TaxID=3711 RepID=A0A398AIC1_BRACM|nr:serine-aspartate repeat-containing protein C-like isoform X1 [Brassica napus]RID74996.1 hypothetical protein BRARA_B02068 [Brassica rapa]